MTERIECGTCGQGFNPADLGAVLLHEHKGITNGASAHMLQEIGPGERKPPSECEAGDA